MKSRRRAIESCSDVADFLRTSSEKEKSTSASAMILTSRTRIHHSVFVLCFIVAIFFMRRQPCIR
jgi:hypothetical protein